MFFLPNVKSSWFSASASNMVAIETVLTTANSCCSVDVFSLMSGTNSLGIVPSGNVYTGLSQDKMMAREVIEKYQAVNKMIIVKIDKIVNGATKHQVCGTRNFLLSQGQRQ